MPLANTLMQIIVKAQEQQAAGRDKQALQSYQKAVAAAKKGTEEEFVTTNLLGQFYDDMQAEDMALDCFRRAQSLASKVFGADSLQLAVAIGNESMVYLNRGDQKKGAPLLDKAAKLLRASDRAKFAALPAYMISAPVSVLCNAAANTMIRGNANEAVLIAKDAFAIAEQNLEVLDPIYMQAGFELCMFMAEAGMRKEEKKLKDKLVETLFGAGCHPSQLLQLMTQVCGNIVGENVLVDGAGRGMFDDPDSDIYLERASNVVPFPGSKMTRPTEQRSKAASKATDSKSKAKAAKKEIEPAGVQLKITLAGVKPPIWRRISIETDASLYDLHEAIQMAMGWTDSHLHEFQIGRYRFGDSSDNDVVNSEHDCGLDDIDLKVGTRFSYMYDFGDGWKHTIEIEKLLSEEEMDATPGFVKAKGACPPEDCGGPYGFMQLLEALKGGHANKDMREWLEMMELSDYDPNAIPDCFEDQIVAEGKKKAKGKVASSKETAVKSKAKSESDAKSKSTIKSVTMQPEPDAATTKKKSGKLEWPGSR
ncbi:MAG: hypothetical protein WC028_02545 [Candidatus Obscuribacterales bacterium]